MKTSRLSSTNCDTFGITLLTEDVSSLIHKLRHIWNNSSDQLERTDALLALIALDPTFRAHVLDFLNNSGKNRWVARNDKLSGTVLYK